MEQMLLSNDFGTEDTYKLYRNVYEIIHPTISKRNISNYKIIVRDDLLPLRIFYPRKISNMEKIIVYIHGKKMNDTMSRTYTDVCLELVRRLDLLVVAIDYSFDSNDYMTVVEKCEQTIKYLYREFSSINIDPVSIIMIGDSIGASILSNIAIINKNNSMIRKLILLYPALDFMFNTEFPSIVQNSKFDLLTVRNLKIFEKKYIDPKRYVSPLSIDNCHNWPNTLVITGDLDPLRDEALELVKKIKSDNKKVKSVNIKFASHGFLNGRDEETLDECYQVMKTFIFDTKKSSHN